jgi:uncharacterized membrane protein
MQFSSLLLILILVVSWSIVPVLRPFQITDIDDFALLLVQQIITLIVCAALFMFFSKSKFMKECRVLKTQSGKWWCVSVLISVATIVGALVFFSLAEKNDMSFLCYAGPLSTVLTLILAAFVGSKINWTWTKICGMVIVLAGTWLLI